MIKAIRFEKTGGSDVLQYVDYDLPPPAKGQVQVRHNAIGANSTATASNSVALGAGSLAEQANTVSVGNDATGQTRRITNVADGVDPHDAATMEQLNSTASNNQAYAKTQELLRAYWSRPMPNAMVLQIEPGDALPAGHPAAGRGMEGGHPTAYICQTGQCSQPITNAADLAAALTLPPQLRQQQLQARATA